MKKKLLIILLVLSLIFSLVGCEYARPNGAIEDIRYDEPYYSLEDVSKYINKYSKLPKNYIKKEEAKDLGWIPSEGNLWEVTDKLVIGGDIFKNREGILPEDDGRTYYECDVNYKGGHRGPERIVFSYDGLIFYTSDHYESFSEIVFE